MENEKEKDLIFKIIALGIIIVLAIAGIFAVSEIPEDSPERTDFKSFEEYKEAGATTIVDIPENAEDTRYYYRNTLIGKQSIYSFVLPDDEDYNDFINKLTGGNGTEKICEKVSDYLDDESDLYKFPMYECFKEVTDDDITEYTVIEFYPQGGGTRTYGIILNEETRRFIVFYFASVR